MALNIPVRLVALLLLLTAAAAGSLYEWYRDRGEPAQAAVDRPQAPVPGSTVPAGLPVPTLSNMPYGRDPRQSLDFYRAKSRTTGPSPVLIFFHGGGFLDGDKRDVWNEPLTQRCLDHGIAVVSVNYRFLSNHPFPAPLDDSIRAVQFVRMNATKWGLDPAKVILSGRSAGGCLAVCIATHDDWAKPDSADPVARESSRAQAVVAYDAQTTLDPAVILREIGGNPEIHPFYVYLFKTADGSRLSQDGREARIGIASALPQVTPDDPPLWLHYASAMGDLPAPAFTPMDISIHSARFGKLMQERYKSFNRTCELRYVGGPGGTDGPDELAFLTRVLKQTKASGVE